MKQIIILLLSLSAPLTEISAKTKVICTDGKCVKEVTTVVSEPQQITEADLVAGVCLKDSKVDYIIKSYNPKNKQLKVASIVEVNKAYTVLALKMLWTNDRDFNRLVEVTPCEDTKLFQWKDCVAKANGMSKIFCDEKRGIK